jgi:hypothetical protein
VHALFAPSIRRNPVASTLATVQSQAFDLVRSFPLTYDDPTTGRLVRAGRGFVVDVVHGARPFTISNPINAPVLREDGEDGEVLSAETVLTAEAIPIRDPYPIHLAVSPNFLVLIQSPIPSLCLFDP